MAEDGAEQLYVTELAQPAVNIGVAVVVQSANSLIDPFFLASRDENDVAGYTGTPVNVNSYLYHYRADVQAAGLQYPLQGQYYVAVDSGRSEFTGTSFAGRYVLRSWVNDVSPPLAAVVTTTVAAGRPTLGVGTLELQSGGDPLTLVLAEGRGLDGAAATDPPTRHRIGRRHDETGLRLPEQFCLRLRADRDGFVLIRARIGALRRRGRLESGRRGRILRGLGRSAIGRRGCDGVLERRP
jgi:hypothetical protein